MMKVGVLASGSGSNFQALADALALPDSPARVVALVCNVKGAQVIQRAQASGISVELIEHGPFGKNREHFELEIIQALRKHQVQLVCLAGFMRLVGPTLLKAFPNAVLNIHPALLPAFPGLHGARQAIAYGVKVSGCTVHLVDEGTDTGPIVAQSAVAVADDDDEKSLADRILIEEHLLYPKVVRSFALGRVHVEGRKVTVTP
jgi:phosphoribosylglycinamide formyltransferase-1